MAQDKDRPVFHRESPEGFVKPLIVFIIQNFIQSIDLGCLNIKAFFL